MNEKALTEEEKAQIRDFFSRTDVYKKAPFGNQPDEFLLGVMKRPVHDGPFSMNPVIELTETVKTPKSYRRKIDET